MPRYRRDDRAVHFDTATCGFSATALISCWSLSADCSELSVNQLAYVSVNVSRDLKLFGGEIIFEVFQPMWSRYLNVTDWRYTVASTRGKNRETKYRRHYRYWRYFKLKIPIYCRFKKPTWTITTPIHTLTGPIHVRCKLSETLWNVLQNEDEHRVLGNVDTKRANYSHLSPVFYWPTFLSLTVWVYHSSYKFVQQASKDASFLLQSAFWPFEVIQGR